jgi:hypothetical protein
MLFACVFETFFGSDLPAPSDALLVFVCPRATEVDALKKILRAAGAWDDVEDSDGSALEVYIGLR